VNHAVEVCSDFFAALFAAWGARCRVSGRNDDVDRRIGQPEREIDALSPWVRGSSREVSAAPQRAASAQTGAAPAASPDKAAAKPAEKPPLQWNVTPDITFKPGLRLQTRYSHDGSTNNNDIAIQRFRLKGAGDAWKAKYALEMKIDNTGTTGKNPTAAVENAWLDYTFIPELAARAGLYDVPFSRDALTSDSKLLFMDRSLIKDALRPGLADGIGVIARATARGPRLCRQRLQQRRFRGLGSAGLVGGDAGRPDRHRPPGSAGGYADYRPRIGQGRRLAIGLNGSRLGGAENLVGTVLQEFDIYAWGTDLFFNWGPYTLQGEYDWFRLTGDVDRSNKGWYVQGGYLIEPLKKALAETAPWFPDLEVAAATSRSTRGVQPRGGESDLGGHERVHPRSQPEGPDGALVPERPEQRGQQAVSDPAPARLLIGACLRAANRRRAGLGATGATA
jgi:hypothetical protein